MDLVILLQPKGDDSPSGGNLEYDQRFTEMEIAATPGEERQIGDEITAATDPDYATVTEKALAVLEQSHDLRAAVYLADSILHSDGLPGFADVIAYIRGCLEDFWQSCHPELDKDDDDDPTMRINTVQGLCGQPDGQGGPSPVFLSLRRMPVTDSRRFGRFSIRDIEIAEGKITAPAEMAGIPDTGAVAAAFQDSDATVLAERLAAARRAEQDVRAISAVFDAKTPGQGPDLGPLIKLLGRIADHFGVYAGIGGPEPDGAAQDEDNATEPVGNGPARAPGTGGINSPSDVSNALDRIIGYYQRNEPSSPVPLLLERAKRLVNADFLTIMQDMAPRGIENVHLIGGIDDD
jgi:type VI secretion system protein ImpA